MRAAIQNSNRSQHVDLKGVSAEEQHATLLLLLLKLKDGFVAPHVQHCSILGNGNSANVAEPFYIVHATLVCKCAIRTWTDVALYKFLIGDVGAAHSFRHTACFI